MTIVTISTMLAKLATLGNKSCDVMISAHDVTNRLLPRGSNYIADVAMWPRFGLFERRYNNLKFIKFDQKKQFLWGVFLVEVQ